MITLTANISYLTAYAAGFVTFFAPCLLPIIPAYVSYVSGVSLNDAQQAAASRRRILLTSASFVLGFLIVFMAFGLAASALGTTLVHYRRPMQIIGGLLMVFVGGTLAGFFELTWLASTKRFNISNRVTRYAWLNAFLLGLAFGFSWTPCIGPVLGVILFWASQSNTFWTGAIMLFIYGLGVGTPFLLVGAFVGRATKVLETHRVLLARLSRAAGYIMIILGILLITNVLGSLSSRFMRFGSLELKLFQLE